MKISKIYLFVNVFFTRQLFLLLHGNSYIFDLKRAGSEFKCELLKRSRSLSENFEIDKITFLPASGDSSFRSKTSDCFVPPKQ